MEKTKEYEDNIFTQVVKRKITRRSFIKWSAAVGATASTAGLITQAGISKAVGQYGGTAPNSVSEVIEWVPTHCLMCHSWCSLAVGIDSDGLPRKIEGQGGQPAYKNRPGGAGDYPDVGARDYFQGGTWGNQDDAHWPAEIPEGYLPYGLNNKGRICAKGNSGTDTLYDPDRVKYPLKRAGDRGSGKWQKISWRQAYFEIATVLRELHGHPDDPAGNAIAGARGQNLAHRHVLYVGRNESNHGGGFKFGSVNRIEHTSVCESSRHIAGLTTWGHHFPFPDIISHTGNRSTYSVAESSVDFMLEVGGNPLEAKIPMTSYGVRWGDRRRDGARMVTVDVRQSNTAAFSDEHLLINPGTDGALALGIMGVMFKELGTSSNLNAAGNNVLEAEILAGHLGGTAHNNGTRRYTGIFSSETGAGAFTPSVAGNNTQTGNSLDPVTLAGGGGLLNGGSLPAPTNTLEDELVAMFGGAPVGSVTDPAAWAAGITGLSAADIEYLAAAVSGADIDGGGPGVHIFDPNDGGYGGATYNNPSVDGYRGPSKHTNGAYNWRALRALQIICGRFPIDASGFFDTGGAGGMARGGMERPGGLIVNGWGANTDGATGTYSPAGQTGGYGVSAAAFGVAGGASLPGGSGLPQNTYPYASNKWNGTHDPVTIDRWDYDQGRPKFGIGTQGADQNVVPAIRASLGLHPYRVGATVTVDRNGSGGDVVLPYGFRQTAFIASTSVTPNGPNFDLYVGPHAALDNLPGATATVYKDGGASSSAGSVVAVNSATGVITVSADPSPVAIGDHLVCEITSAANIPDKDFQVESLMLFKIGHANTNPNIKLEQELLTAKDGAGNYKLKHIWAVDAFMGDMSRFADIILPDTSYLERFDNKDWENMGLKGWWGMRQPVMRQNMGKNIWDPDSKELFLYEARPINSIQMELQNACAKASTGANPFGGYTGGDAIYDALGASGDEDYDPSVGGSTGNPDWDALPLAGIGAHKQGYYNKCNGGTLPSLAVGGAHGGWAFMRVFGNVHDSNQIINEYTGFDSNFFGFGGWKKQNAPRTWLNDDLAAAGAVADWADNDVANGGPGNGYTALEVFNRRMEQILEAGIEPTPAQYANATGYKFQGVPVWQEPTQQTGGGHPRHLTTYKLNVHTQSRTAQNALLTEIIGNCWAVIGSTTSDAGGYYTLDDASGAKIYSGDRVKVETAQGWVKLEAKVTPKVKVGVCAISNSFGHEGKGQNPDTIGQTQGVNTVYGNADAFGHYQVDKGAGLVDNRSDAASYPYGPIDSYRLAYASVAPGRGVHPNHAINRTANDLQTSKSLNCCPIGTSIGWFDSKCKVTKA